MIKILGRWHKIGSPDCLLKTQFRAMISIIVFWMKFAQCLQYKRGNFLVTDRKPGK